MELARQRTVADTEIRIRRDLVEDLLAGASPETALARGEAFQRDLSQPHRALVFESRGTLGGDQLFTSVRRAARELSLGSLLVSRGGTVVVLTDREIDWHELHSVVTRELVGGHCRLGVGSPTQGVEDFPNSHREAVLSLQLQRDAAEAPDVTVFDQLGVYRLLAATEDTREIERFVRDWLGLLVDYDEARHAQLVPTLHQYLECGGAYDQTAAALSIHRSTLKYRLQRIREVSGLALGTPDVNFNLQLACRAWRTLQSLRS
jgi:DNA-binding PucR family transcriptional regulator